MKFAATTLAFSLSAAALATPTVSNVAMGQLNSKKISIAYTVDEPTVVTLDVLTNAHDDVWVSIGGPNVTNVTGDVNIPVSAGDHSIVWIPDASWKSLFASEYTVKAVVRAWATNAPPTYMVIDLTKRQDKGVVQRTVHYYESPEFFPDGPLSKDIYRTDRMVLRRIPAKGVTWRMGAPDGEQGKARSENDWNGKETVHYVTLTADYYLAIFETTKHQFYLGLRDWAYDKSDHMVPASAAYETLRGPTSEGYDWPTDGHATKPGYDESVFGFAREKYGVDFDLPTEAQWEFACRAGTRTALYTGGELTGDLTSDNLDAIAWYQGNSGNALHRVGELQPNAFGLYDMLGNVCELCLDWMASDRSSYTAAEIDPVGVSSGTFRVLKGGAFTKYSYYCRSAFRMNYVTPVQEYSDCGFRVCVPAVAK